MSKARQFVSKRPWLVVLTLAVLVRVIYFITRYPYAGEEYLLVDTLFHHKWALAIASGDWLGRETFFRAPLYPYALGLLYFIFGESARIGFVFGQLLGIISIYLTYRIAYHVAGGKAAFVAALIQSIYPITIFYEGELLVEGLFVVLVQASILSLFNAAESDRRKWPILTGLFLGLAALTRPVILALVPLYLLWYIIIKRRSPHCILKTASILMVMFLVILPVTVRNLLVGRDATLIASSGGINFYIGNNEHADGLSATHPPPLTNDWRITDIKYAAESATGKELTPSEISSFYYNLGWNWISNNKLEFAELYLKKLYYSLNNFEISNNRNLVYEFSNNGLLGILPISFWFIIGLTVLGFFAPADSPNRKRLKIFLILFPLLYITTISFYFINARFRLPILPLLFILAASGAIWLYNNVKTGRNFPKTAIALLMGIVVSAFSLTNLYHHDSADISGGLFNRANNYFAAGDLPTAADYYRRVLSNRPDYPEAALNLGALFLKAGRGDSARIYFEREYRLYPDNPRVLANLASLQYLDGNHDSAIILADRAIALRPYFDDPHLVKLRALAAQNDIAGINRLLEKASRTISDPARLYLDAGIIFSEIKDFDASEKYLSLAFSAKPAPPETDDAAFSNIHKISGRDITSIRARAAYQLGYIYGLTGNFRQSVDFSNAALALDSNLVEAYVNLISGYFSLGNSEQARRVLTLADRKFPNNEAIAILKSRLQ
jgi:4-amino-4-deoxy-L-arabinose transferase-like glycosyltransferase